MAAAAPQRRVFVVGVGMTKFRKPQKAGPFNPEEPEFPEFAQTAVRRALDDSQLTFDDIQFATVGCTVRFCALVSNVCVQYTFV